MQTHQRGSQWGLTLLSHPSQGTSQNIFIEAKQRPQMLLYTANDAHDGPMTKNFLIIGPDFEKARLRAPVHTLS